MVIPILIPVSNNGPPPTFGDLVWAAVVSTLTGVILFFSQLIFFDKATLIVHVLEDPMLQSYYIVATQVACGIALICIALTISIGFCKLVVALFRKIRR